MGKAKEKKVNSRDQLRNELAELIMKARNLTILRRTKEGLVLKNGDEYLVIKVILKKDPIERTDVVETLNQGKVDMQILLTEAEKFTKNRAKIQQQQKMIEKYGPSLPKQENNA